MERLVIPGALMALVVVAAASAARDVVFPARIDLPDGWQPEGIAVSATTGSFYVGSIPTGAIYRGSVRTGKGSVLVPAKAGRQAIGIELDNRGRLFVAGGPTGDGWVVDARTGADMRSYELTTDSSTFVNDVVVTRGGAYFTDSMRAVLYRVPIAANGALGAARQEIALRGDYVHEAGFSLNGIDATPDGRTLVVVQSGSGRLYTVSPASGVARRVDLGGATVTNGDGILLDGRTLYVVRNRQNRIAVVRLAPSMRSGRVVRTLANAGLSVPTTIDDHGRRLYAVNARFGTPATATTDYWVTRLAKPPGL